mmetsp:Transcript_11838/g.13414  ORF Transcript_11838/g.13414 Transcript_11838/m.13414 type:complete len:136 (-) Transcript_11838:184-591(-)
MGGGNAQKSAAAREKNLKNVGKTDEERRAAQAKAKADSVAYICKICKATFMCNAGLPQLHQHFTSRHPALKEPTECFDCLSEFDPDDPKGLKKKAAAAEAAKKTAKKPKKKAGAGVASLDDMLNAGLAKGKKKKK